MIAIAVAGVLLATPAPPTIDPLTTEIGALVNAPTSSATKAAREG